MCIHASVEKSIKEGTRATTDKPWSPIWISGCSLKKCPERTAIIKYLVRMVKRNRRPSINFISAEAIKEANYSQESALFSELSSIESRHDLSDEKKIALVSVPTKVRINWFLEHLFDLTRARTEVIVFQIILLKRLIEVTNWSFRADTWRTMLIISLRIAQKIEGFVFPPTKILAEVYKTFDADELEKLEDIFRSLLDSRIEITPQEYLGQLKQAINQECEFKV